MKNRLWKYTAGANCAEPIIADEARRIAWQGGDGVIVVEAADEGTAYRRASTWASLDAHDDVGDLGLDWRWAGAAVLIEY